MITRNKLNCYIFSNLIISFLSLNLVTNNSNVSLVMKESDNTLNKIYEKEVVQVISTPDTIISSENVSNVVAISNKTIQNEKTISYQKPSYNSLTGSNLVNYAMKFIGLRYVSAGRSLATGTDCSGFTRLIYQEFGIQLGTTVSSQLYSGTYVNKNDLQPGDLVFYSYGSVASHVAIYIGNGLIIHESTPRDGVKISSVNIMNYITARRLITSNVVSPSVVEEKKTNPTPVTEVPEVSQDTVDNKPVEEIKEETPVIEEPIENNVVEEVVETTEEVKEEVVVETSETVTVDDTETSQE